MTSCERSVAMTSRTRRSASLGAGDERDERNQAAGPPGGHPELATATRLTTISGTVGEDWKTIPIAAWPR